jgi:hypothetical protein
MQRLLSDVRAKNRYATNHAGRKKTVAMALPADSRDLAFTGPGSSFFLYSMLTVCFDSGV